LAQRVLVVGLGEVLRWAVLVHRVDDVAGRGQGVDVKHQKAVGGAPRDVDVLLLFRFTAVDEADHAIEFVAGLDGGDRQVVIIVRDADGGAGLDSGVYGALVGHLLREGHQASAGARRVPPYALHLEGILRGGGGRPAGHHGIDDVFGRGPGVDIEFQRPALLI